MYYLSKYYKYKAKYFLLKAGTNIEQPNEENLGQHFFPRLNSETKPYIYLIGGGNEIKKRHRYANLQNDPGSGHPFINDFLEGPQSFTSRNLEEAIILFKKYPDKNDFGVSLSICFIDLDNNIIDSAYCLLAYNSQECHNQYYIDLEDNDLQVVEDKVSLDAEPLPVDLNITVPEFTVV